VILIPRKDDVTEENKKLWFDLICGAVFSILALTGIIVMSIMYGITNTAGFLIGLIFWSFYLLGSLLLMGWGIYTKKPGNKYGKKRKKKELRPPIVS